jgi:hypothetical protein
VFISQLAYQVSVICRIGYRLVEKPGCF